MTINENWSECDITDRKWLTSGSNQIRSVQLPFSFVLLDPACQTPTWSVSSYSPKESLFLWQSISPIRSVLVGRPHPYHFKAGYRNMSNLLDVGCGGQQALPTLTEASNKPVYELNHRKNIV